MIEIICKGLLLQFLGKVLWAVFWFAFHFTWATLETSQVVNKSSSSILLFFHRNVCGCKLILVV